MASQSQLVAGNMTQKGYFVYPVIQHGSHIVAVDFDSVSVVSFGLMELRVKSGVRFKMEQIKN